MITRRQILGAAVAGAAGLAIGGDAKAQEAPATRTVFLTSDDGPVPGTATIIDIAERQKIPITLFMIGMNAAADRGGRSVLERAHSSEWITVANHSYSHCSGHYVRCYHDSASLVSDFERANGELGLASSPFPARGPGRDVWRLPGMRIDDHAISSNETRVEETAYDSLFDKGFHLYGWDVEWAHRHGIPRQSSSKMIDYLAGGGLHTRRPNKVMMLMHDVMIRTPRGASEFNRIIDGVRRRGATFGRLSEY
jgi:peptidoglycan/xylan/chitin deacetylase (PgdA/CDA1 family)